MFNVQCLMFNVQCSMFNVQCSMFNVQSPAADQCSFKSVIPPQNENSFLS